MRNHLTKKSKLGAKKKFHSCTARFPNKLPNFLDFARYSRENIFYNIFLLSGQTYAK